MADPAEEMDVEMSFHGTYFSGIPYNYTFNLTEHEDTNVYGGIGRSIMPYNNHNPNDEEILNDSNPVSLHAIHFQNSGEKISYQSGMSSNSFTPFFQMNPPSPLESTTIVVGKSAGVRLDVWMRKPGRILWEMDNNNTTYTTRFGSDRRKLGRWVGGAVTTEHAHDRFIGNLLNSTYVDEQAQKVVFVKDQQLQGSTTIAGIQDDLKQLNELVLWVNRDFYNPFQSATPDNLTVYTDLYPGDNNLPSNLAELKNLSYILCHNFLYFEAGHRFSFATMYRSFRQRVSSFRLFSLKVVLININEIAETWEQQMPSSEIVLNHIFATKHPIHKGKEGLIHFIRSCKEHYNEEAKRLGQPYLTEKELDEKFLELFPNAIHRAFNALVKGGFTNDSIVEGMKEVGIDFTKE